MAVVGCYALDLYCDVGGDPYGGFCPNKPPLGGVFAQYTGKNERHVLKQARAHGWRFFYGSTEAACPRCAKQGLKP